MHVPVELSRRNERTRWFRLSTDINADALRFAQEIPDDLDGPLALAFHLPGDPLPVRCGGRAVEEIVGEGEDERAEHRAIALFDLDDEARARITNYVTERLG
ncbi:MAG TPA: hypothetical protein VF945_21195 [Polyangia bacterium]